MYFIVCAYFYLIAILQMSCFLTTPENHNKIVAETSCGKVRGVWNESDSAFSFRGIPYASPPVGTLRWRPTVPLNPINNNCWSGILDATTFGEQCFQLVDSQHVGNEDCLFLNVWTPTLSNSARLPVMFWLHGGYLLNGNGNQHDIGYAPTTKLVNETNMVYVSVNYRLQAFGFMALDWLKDGSPTNTSGNYGLMDMIEGLKWIQNNIHNFGGDPNQVTVFGQSSGGSAIVALLSSPLCQGLFHKAWMLSASPILNKTASDAFKDNEVFINRTGCQDVDCLYNLTSSEVTDSVPWNVYPYWAMDDQNDLPNIGRFDGALLIVDGYVLEEAPFDAWVHGNCVDVPVLIGTTAQETELNPVPPDVYKWTWDSGMYENYVKQILGNFSDVIAETALKLYPHGFKTPEYQLTTMTSDARMTCANDYLSLIAATSFKSPIFRYVTTYCPSRTTTFPFGINYPARYSFHGIDIFAFFGTMDHLLPSPSSSDKRWEDSVRRDVISFVENGHPDNPFWQPFPSTAALLSDITNITSAYHVTECEFWMANGFFSYAWIN